MDVKLKVLEGKQAGQQIAITGKKFFIGRAEDCHLRPGSDLISRHHCVILVEEGYVGVRDFGSKNGTYVNDERVVGEREIKVGDQMRVGPLQFEICIAHGIGGKKRPPVADVKEAAARAAGSSASLDIDVSEWLAGEPEPKKSGASPQETQRLRVGDTEEIRLGETRDISKSNDETVAAPMELPVAKDDSTIRKPPGKLPPPPKKASKDSQEAATAMLNMFRKRR
jgi:predicted component of type VI protein secretion system